MNTPRGNAPAYSLGDARAPKLDAYEDLLHRLVLMNPYGWNEGERAQFLRIVRAAGETLWDGYYGRLPATFRQDHPGLDEDALRLAWLRLMLEEIRDWLRDTADFAASAAAKSGCVVQCAGVGCNSCCVGGVDVLYAETLLQAPIPAWMSMRARAAAERNETARPSDARSPRVGPGAWATGISPPAPARRCAALTVSGACGIYEERPIACRATLNTSARNECGPGTSTACLHAPKLLQYALATADALLTGHARLLLDVLARAPVAVQPASPAPVEV